MTSASVGGPPPPMGIYDYDRRAWQQPQPFAAAWGAEAPFRHDVTAAQAAVTGAAGVLETETKFADRVVMVQAAAPVDDAAPSSDSFGHDDARHNDKVMRRLAQNREAARKSRLRKKAYIQNLESSRMKLAMMEQELTNVRRQQQGVFVFDSGTGLIPPPPPPAAAINSAQVVTAAFESEYARWAEEQDRRATELRAALEADAPDPQLRALVDAALSHYDALFRFKSAAARSDALLVLSGAWRAPAERFFLWVGGFRPSEVLATLAPRLGALAEPQAAAVRALQVTARQLEDAVSQGVDRLQQRLTEALVAVDDGAGGGGFDALAMVGSLAGFVDQADYLRQQTLRNVVKILTPQQAAAGMLALADFCQRLRALSTLWAARPREPA